MVIFIRNTKLYEGPRGLSQANAGEYNLLKADRRPASSLHLFPYEDIRVYSSTIFVSLCSLDEDPTLYRKSVRESEPLLMTAEIFALYQWYTYLQWCTHLCLPLTSDYYFVKYLDMMCNWVSFHV